MKINQIISETTVAGGVAPVVKPMGETQKRTTVKGLEPAEKVMSGKTKKKGPYQNSLSEGKIKDLSMDLRKDKDGLNDIDFKKKYGKTKEEMRKAMKQKPEPVKEAKLDEDDIIVVPGAKIKRKTGFVQHGQSRVDHEVEMARSDVLATMKNAKAIYKLLQNKTEEDGIEGWVQEKLIKANDYLNAVKEYYDEKMMQPESAVNEKAVSKAQQKFFGMAHAMQKGAKIKGASKELKDVAKSMTKSDVKDFAKTKHKGLPQHVSKKD